MEKETRRMKKETHRMKKETRRMKKEAHKMKKEARKEEFLPFDSCFAAFHTRNKGEKKLIF